MISTEKPEKADSQSELTVKDLITLDQADQ